MRVEYGRVRTVLISNEWVYKYPLNDEGRLANAAEKNLSQWNRENPGRVEIPIAPCEMLDDTVLAMRRVDPYRGNGRELPSWTMSVDCNQVGYLNGDLVAYDL